MVVEHSGTPRTVVSILCLGLLASACSSSSDNDDGDAAAGLVDMNEAQKPVDDSLPGDDDSPEATSPIAYCSAADPDASDPAFVLFDFPANERFDELRDATASLADLAVLTQLASFATDNQLIPASRLFCDYQQAQIDGCTTSQVPRSTVRDVVLAGSTLSFSVDTEDGQSSDYVIQNPDYSMASLQSTSRSGSVLAVETARDSEGSERVQIIRGGRTTVMSEARDCSGSLMSVEGMMTTLSAEWTSPAESKLTLRYELCENGAARGADCITGSLSVP